MGKKNRIFNLKPRGPRRLRAGLSEGGWTLIELMLVTALIAIITPAITYLFVKVQQGMAADEMRLNLTKINEQTTLRIHETLATNRHLFQNDASGTAFMGPVTNGMSANTKAVYPILAGSQLPLQQPITGTGSFSPVTAISADFGNSLLFAAYDVPQTIGGQIYLAPATVTGALNSYGTPTTVIIHLYRFYYYYLTTSGAPLRDVKAYRLVEWQSMQYANYNELNDIADSTLQGHVITWLTTPGNLSPTNAGYALTVGYDPTQSALASAFYNLNASLTSVTPASFPEGTASLITFGNTGIMSGGFGYGVSPNSTGWPNAPKTVPLYGTASGSFPGGFETGISGTAAGKEVMIRELLVAQGAAPKVVWNDETVVDSVRDTW